jgi:hypothetical protein
MGTENIDWKNAGIGAAKVVLGVATVAAGVTGGPAGATGVQQVGGGLDQALGGLGVGNVGLSQTGAPAPPPPPLLLRQQRRHRRPYSPSRRSRLRRLWFRAAPPPPLVPPQTQPSRLERFERDGRPLPSPAPPPAPTAEELSGRTSCAHSLPAMEPKRSADSGGWTLSGQSAADWAHRARHRRSGERNSDGDGAWGDCQTGAG